MLQAVFISYLVSLTLPIEACPTLTHVIALNFAIISNFYRCQRSFNVSMSCHAWCLCS